MQSQLYYPHLIGMESERFQGPFWEVLMGWRSPLILPSPAYPGPQVAPHPACPSLPGMNSFDLTNDLWATGMDLRAVTKEKCKCVCVGGGGHAGCSSQWPGWSGPHSSLGFLGNEASTEGEEPFPLQLRNQGHCQGA